MSREERAFLRDVYLVLSLIIIGIVILSVIYG